VTEDFTVLAGAVNPPDGVRAMTELALGQPEIGPLLELP
jgi:hypothetical protein